MEWELWVSQRREKNGEIGGTNAKNTVADNLIRISHLKRGMGPKELSENSERKIDNLTDNKSEEC